MRLNFKKRSVTLFFFLLIFSCLFSRISYTRGLEQAEIDALVAEIPQTIMAEIYEEWTSPSYEMLLIVPDNQDFIDRAQVLADWKTTIGIPTLVVSNYSLYPGIDDPEKIRNMIISLRQMYPIQWVLLMGDTDIIPIRYIYNPDGLLIGTSEAIGSSTLKPTDYYYAELSSNWDVDGDGIWGEDIKYSTATEMDFFPEVYVGRFPADTAEELGKMINKTIYYEQAQNAGVWMNNYIAASGISDHPNAYDQDGEFEAVLNQYLIDNYIDENMNWTHVYEYDAGFYPDPVAPEQLTLVRSSMRENINSGCSIAIWAGHGSPTAFTPLTISAALNTADLPSLANTNMFSLLIGDACSTNSYDQENSLGEQFFRLNTTGGIGYIGAMRISWYYANDSQLQYLNRGITKQLLHEMFEHGYYQQGKALYEAKRSYANSAWMQSLGPDFQYIETERKTITTYMLLGDPSVDIFTDEPGNFDPLEFESMPVYEGEKTEIQILTTEDAPVPNASVVISSDSGFYRTFRADNNGIATIELPTGVREYNYTLFAHNMVYKNGTFTTIADTNDPEIGILSELTPENPTNEDNIFISAGVTDLESGIAEVVVAFSTNNFTTYQYFILEKQGSFYEGYFPKLESNSYQYGIIVFDRVGHNDTYFWKFTVDEAIQEAEDVPAADDPADNPDDDDDSQKDGGSDAFDIDGFQGLAPILLLSGSLIYLYKRRAENSSKSPF